MLHHDDGVPLVAQRLQDADEPVRVAGVQPHRRLVEDEERADEPRAERGGEGDPLRLPSRQRGRGAIEGQVVEPHVLEEGQPAVHLVQRPAPRSPPPPGRG